MRNFHNLRVWQRSHKLTLEVYCITQNFSGEEKFGLISQMRRSSSSVPTNIAEGCGRNGDAELKRFMVFSMGSLSELEYQLLLSNDLNYLSNQEFTNLNQQIKELKKMLTTFIKRLTGPQGRANS
ncbi:MAG: four helix bundle protein [Ardenticatenaceae bacterium]|nr:four helix bundle protein [Ardenticatenaceae bacterium]